MDDFNLRSIGSRWRQVNSSRNYSGLILPLTHKYKKFEINAFSFVVSLVILNLKSKAGTWNPKTFRFGTFEYLQILNCCFCY